MISQRLQHLTVCGSFSRGGRPCRRLAEQVGNGLLEPKDSAGWPKQPREKVLQDK